jgi:enediyne biosynthesis protein E4
MRGDVHQWAEDVKLIMRAILAGAALGAMSLMALGQDVASPKFVEETQSAGIDSVYAGEWEYMVGGGAASFDCNADGFPDLLLSGGEKPAAFYANKSARGGALKFERQKSGLELSGVIGTYPLDIDGDGNVDLVLLRIGENAVMRGLGGCIFERANEAWGFDGGNAWSAAFAATWEQGAAWPTIAIGNYIDRKEDISPWGSCTPNWLHRPMATERKFAPPLALKPSFCALSMLFTDWNRSGAPSLRISNDREYYEGGQEQLWKLQPGAAPAPYTEAEGWKPLRIWGMGIASTDLNGDGLPDYFLTSMADQKLQTLATPPASDPALPTFKDVAFARGVTAHRPFMGADLKPSTGWHAQFEDVNNDGLVDLFIAKGNVDRMPDFALKDPNNLLVQLPDGKFKEVAGDAGVALVVVNRRECAQLWRNVTPGAGHWLAVRLTGDGPNRDGIGSWIEVRHGTQIVRREITSGGGHASGQLGWWHFGLGADAKADVRVTWPGATASDWQAVEGDRFYVAVRGKPIAAWTAK